MSKSREKYNIEDRESYLILIKEKDAGYSICLGYYIFYSPNVSRKVVSDINDLNDIEEKYIIICDNNNEIIRQWKQENYPNNINDDVIVNANYKNLETE